MIWLVGVGAFLVGATAGLLWERSQWKTIYRRGMMGDSPSGPFIVVYDDMEEEHASSAE